MNTSTIKKKIVLASASLRRKEILETIGLTFKVVPSNYDEVLNPNIVPDKQARIISYNKAVIVAKKFKKAIIIAADTFIVSSGNIIGKPLNAEDATKILCQLSGKKHRVVTGFTIIDTQTGRRVSRSVSTFVWFNRLSLDQIRNYVATGEPLDKAGAYAIQGYGALLVRKIEGDYLNVVGLPLNAVVKELRKFGLSVPEN